MAKRSDFAQKLLDDLRLRKERLSTSQNSTHSRTQSRDAYGYSKQTFRGSSKEPGKAAIRASSMQSKSIGHQRSMSREQSSNQIVPFQKNCGSQQMGDFSMALSFALQNGGKLKRVDSSMLTFLHQISGGAVDFSKMTRNTGSTSRVPTLTHLHIKEVARGAQKLNQILSACSNGLNFDQYSIKIGNELLKGAMDLQDSLRMLVDLQEASDVMVTPQRKNRIVLLENGEEDETVEQKQKQLDLPRFSFDKPRTHFQLQTLVNSTNSTSHMPSVGYGDGMKQDNVFGSPQPKAEKGRISNVIAKLMGLEEGTEDKTTKLKSVGKKDDKNLVTLATVREASVEKRVANDRARSDVLSKPMWKSPEKMDQKFHRQEKDKKNERVKALDGKRTQEKVLSSNRVKQRRKVESDKKAYVIQKRNAAEERKLQTDREKKGTCLTSKELSKPYNETTVVHKYLSVVEKLNGYTDAKVNPGKIKGGKKSHGIIEGVVIPDATSVTPQEVKKVTLPGKRTLATQQTVTKSLKSKNDDLYGSEEELCIITKDEKTYVADSVETNKTSIKLLSNVRNEAPTPNGLITSAHKLDKVVVHEQDMDERQVQQSDDSGKTLSSAGSNNLHSQETAFGKDSKPELANIISTGNVSEIANRSSDFHLTKIQDPLTEFESWFKCILLESRLFVDTANALFKLNISAKNPSICSNDYHECDNKLILDCGYEIMKRKGRLQEHTFHPFMSIHFSLMKIVSLDDLVKKLTRDFEKLKQYGRNGIPKYEVEDYPRMIECDFHVRDPEINSMWDLGWNDEVLAFIENDKVVKDVEKQLLAELIEEATRDLLHM